MSTTNSGQTASLAGKTCMVTGGNTGLGKSTALALARMGAQVIIFSRDPAKGATAQAEIKSATGNAQVDVLVGDLSSQRSIRNAVAEFKSRYQKLHVLVNNAGVNVGTRTVTEDGLEATFATNHLGPFLLTNLLLDVLKASAPSRIVNVSSGAHAMGDIQLDDLGFEKKYSPFKAYSQSKLANVLFTFELARKLQGTGVTVNAVDPGTVRTSLGSDQRLFRILVKLPIFVTPEKGALTAIRVASAPELEKVTGKYFAKEKEKESSKRSQDAALAKQLWDISAKLTHLTA